MENMRWSDLSAEDQARLAPILTSARKRHRVVVRYDGGDEPGWKSLAPLSLRKSADGNTLLYGLSADGNIKSFSIERIHDIVSLTDDYPDTLYPVEIAFGDIERR